MRLNALLVILSRDWLAQLFTEIIIVDLPHFVCSCCGNANPEINHKVPQLLAVDEDDLALNASRILDRLFRKIGGRNKDALLGSEPLQGPGKLLNLRPADRLLPLLRLDVNRVQPKAVLLDDSINALVPTLADCLPRVLSGSAISHPDKQLHHQSLKK